MINIQGDVQHPTILTFDDLRALPQIDDVSELVDGRQGTAVRLVDALAVVKPTDKAVFATLESGDGTFSASVELDALQHALLVYRDQDAALPESLGGPVRFLIPDAEACHTGGADSCANVKQLATITLSETAGRDTRGTETPH